MFCPRCGADVGPQPFCPHCGAAIARTMRPAPPTQPVSSRRSWTPLVLAGAAAGVITVLLVAILVAVRGPDEPSGTTVAGVGPSPPAAPPAGTATITPSPEATRTVVSPPKTKAPVGDVRDLPADLFCRDLRARGYSYTAAIDYWRFHGQPDRMDADRNGIPCETVYPPSDVSAYWRGRDVPSYESGALPPGLFCRDLFARGVSYFEAVEYWWYHGAPDRMDADRNGIPCETVYPAAEVDAFWFG